MSGCCLEESLVITASMELSLRLYANAACVVGANKYPAKSKLGEVNLLDGDEARVSRKEHWGRPSMEANLKDLNGSAIPLPSMVGIRTVIIVLAAKNQQPCLSRRFGILFKVL